MEKGFDGWNPKSLRKALKRGGTGWDLVSPKAFGRQMILYHGSDHVVENPALKDGRPMNDYGRGLYCTQDLELAKEWACKSPDRNGWANEYVLNPEGLRIASLGEGEESVLFWASVLICHRIVDANPTARERADFIKKNWPAELNGIDVAVGYRADDSYFSFVRQFLSGLLSLEDLMNIMHFGGLGKQIVLLSDKAFSKLTFVKGVEAEAKIYYPRRVERESRASRDYQSGKYLAMQKHAMQVYITDIVRWAGEPESQGNEKEEDKDKKEDLEL